MTAWIIVLTPLLVLPVVLLFRFVGCGGPELSDEPIVQQVPLGPPRYRDYILPDPDIPNPAMVKNAFVVPKAEDVIAYWRLVDVFGTVAVDEKGFQHGTYQTVASPIVEPPTSDEAGSQDANPGGAGIIKLAATGLIDSDTKKKGATFLGGFVVVQSRLAAQRLLAVRRSPEQAESAPGSGWRDHAGPVRAFRGPHQS